MSARFECRPLALALFALNSAPVLADTPAAEAAAPDMPPPAAAAEALPVLEEVTVIGLAVDSNPNAQPGVPYKARTSGDERHTRPLAETPKNIAVITKTAIEDSGYTDLRQILDAQPGITLGTGENGNAFGDRYIIRGQEARSDVFVDGLRDPGMTVRESFAIEQVEIAKSPSSSFAGRGTAGGAVNSISKLASPFADFAKLSVGVGSDQYTRVTADANKAVSETLALRVNALHAYQQVPDRAPADRERQGLAVSTAWQPTEKLELIIDYYGLRAEDRPDLGNYLQGTYPNRRPADNVPAYLQAQDFLRSDVDSVTARVKYRIDEDLRLSNTTRHGKTGNEYVVTGARSATTGANNPGGQYATATLSTHSGWQDVDYLANQTNLFINKTLFGKAHEFIVSLEYTDHQALKGNFTSSNSGQNCHTGSATTPNAWCIFDANGKPVNGLNTLMNRQITRNGWNNDWQITTTALALMDTVDLTDKLVLFAGVRADRFDFDLAVLNTTTNVVTRYDYGDTLLNSHVGLSYRFTPELVGYASHATAMDINGGEADAGTNSGYGGAIIKDGEIAGADPERSQNLELGLKWDVFNRQLLLTGAVFRITKDDVMEGNGYTTTGTFNSARNRVQGVELGASGLLMERIEIQAGVTAMEAEVLKSATPLRVGKTLSNFAELSGVLQLGYRLSDKLTVGGAVKYEGEKYAGQPDTAPAMITDTSSPYYGQYSQPIPAYTVYDLFARYRANKQLSLRANVGNVSNEDYYLAGYQSGAFLYKGDARTLRFTLDYDF
ncbi:MAG: TonB-dependent receptor [Moraxellaceae bacterium]